MDFAHERTDVLLNGFVKQIEPKPQSWRVISIEFQDCETLHAPLFQNLCLKNINNFFHETDCKIFWHQPHLLLIFFQGRAMPIEKCVEGFLKETEFKGFGRFFDILDLSIHWDNLLSLVQRFNIGIESKTEIEKNTVQSPQKPPIKTESVLPSEGFTIELSAEKINNLKPTRKARTLPLILLVEDDPFTLQLVKLAFKEGFEVITAETARQALVYYQRHLPNMVFMDIQLPDGNGINLLQQISKVDTESHIVMLSSHSQKEKILDALQFGAKGFIAKPFTRQRLSEATDKFKAQQKKLNAENNRHGT